MSSKALPFSILILIMIRLIKIKFTTSRIQKTRNKFINIYAEFTGNYVHSVIECKNDNVTHVGTIVSYLHLAQHNTWKSTFRSYVTTV